MEHKKIEIKWIRKDEKENKELPSELSGKESFLVKMSSWL